MGLEGHRSWWLTAWGWVGGLVLRVEDRVKRKGGQMCESKKVTFGEHLFYI